MHLKSKITVICFCILLFGLTLISVIKPPTIFSEKENRYLTQKPAFSFASLFQGSYTSAYEDYLSDQFPGRDGWIRLQSRSEQLLQKKEINQVYLADDHYLIEKLDRQDFVSAQAQKNTDSLSAFVQNQSRALGPSHVRVMVVPSASQILTHKLPSFAAVHGEQEFLDAVRLGVGEEHFVDVSAALLSHQDESVYYRTDHHWTTLGAFYGYQAWAKASGFTPYEIRDFSVETVTDSFYGTLQAKVNLPLVPDSMERFSLASSPVAYTVTYNESEDIRDNLYEWSALDTRDKYRFYLNGNQPIVRIETSVPSGRNLLVIKDSFANCFVPFAANHFGRTLVVDLRYFNGDVKALMDAYSITDILILYQASFLAAEPSVSRLSLW